MKIIVTAKELMDKGLWESFCEKKGINLHAVNEGQMDSDERILLSNEEANELGLII